MDGVTEYGQHIRPPSIQDLLGPPVTREYRPSVIGMPAWAGFGTGGRFFDLSVVDLMMLDATCALGIQMLEAPIRTAEGRWAVQTDDDRVRRFINHNLTRIWKGSLGIPLMCLRYGYSGSEVLYYQNAADQLIYVNQLRYLHPRDIALLTDTGMYAGVRVKGGAGASRSFHQPFDLAGPTKDPVRPAKGLWVYHGTSSSNMYYGRSRMIAAWAPWRDLNAQDGALDIVRMWYYKNAYSSIRIRHPERDIMLPDGSRVPARDYARQIGEWIKTGGIVALPSTKDPRTGEFLWQIEDPKLLGNADGLLDYVKYLEGRIMRGLLIPDNVVTESASTGAYSGRKVPEDAFYVTEEEILHAILMALNDQILRPLVSLNFGKLAQYELTTQPLVPIRQQQAEAQAGQQGAEQGGDPNNPAAKLLGGQDKADNQETEDMRNASQGGGQAAMSLGQHSYSTTQFNLPEPLCGKLEEFADCICQDDLGEEGVCDDHHITAKYGLLDETPDRLHALLRNFGPVTVKLGPLSVFKQKDCDVLKIEVVSRKLRKLHHLLARSVANTENFSVYRPHITLAYLKPNVGKKYVGKSCCQGIRITFDKLSFRNKEGEACDIYLSKKPMFTASGDAVLSYTTLPPELQHDRKKVLASMVKLFKGQQRQVS